MDDLNTGKQPFRVKKLWQQLQTNEAMTLNVLPKVYVVRCFYQVFVRINAPSQLRAPAPGICFAQSIFEYVAKETRGERFHLPIQIIPVLHLQSLYVRNKRLIDKVSFLWIETCILFNLKINVLARQILEDEWA